MDSQNSGSVLDPATPELELIDIESLRGAALVLKASPAAEPVVGPCATRRAA